MTTPRRIEWRAPEGWTVWADEDGVHLRSRTGDCLEAPDVMRLIALINEAGDHVARDHIPAPKPLGREEAAALHSDDRDEYIARRAHRAIAREFSPDPTPF